MGESEYLGKALEAIKAHRALWGTDAPKKREVGGIKDAEPIRFIAGLPDDESEEQIAERLRPYARVLSEMAAEDRFANRPDAEAVDGGAADGMP